MKTKWKYIPVLLIAAGAACISQAEHPLLPPSAVGSTALIVETGFTEGSEGLYPGQNLGEYSAFSLSWSEVPDAAFYEIRASEVPLTAAGWNEAIPVGIINAPADSGLAFNVIEVQAEPCIGCGLCEQECPNDAITVQGGVAVIDYDKCTSCGLCQDVCPVNAIAGTRNGQDYYFGIRAFYGEGLPAEDISVTEGAYRIVFYNAWGNLWTPQTKNCGLCQPGADSLGCFGGCHIVEDWADEDRTVFTGTGCPYDAIWQDTSGTTPRPFMVYVDYEECQSCGKCFVECWNYNSVIDPLERYQGLRSMMHRVVPAGWVSEQPVRP